MFPPGPSSKALAPRARNRIDGQANEDGREIIHRSTRVPVVAPRVLNLFDLLDGGNSNPSPAPCAWRQSSERMNSARHVRLVRKAYAMRDIRERLLRRGCKLRGTPSALMRTIGRRRNTKNLAEAARDGSLRQTIVSGPNIKAKM